MENEVFPVADDVSEGDPVLLEEFPIVLSYEFPDTPAPIAVPEPVALPALVSPEALFPAIFPEAQAIPFTPPLAIDTAPFTICVPPYKRPIPPEAPRLCPVSFSVIPPFATAKAKKIKRITLITAFASKVSLIYAWNKENIRMVTAAINKAMYPSFILLINSIVFFLFVISAE